MGTHLTWPAEQPELTDGVITLRPLHSADADRIYEMCQDSEIQIHTRMPSPYRRADADEAVAMCHEQWRARSGVRFIAIDAAGDLVGSCGLPHVDARTGVAEAGYAVAAWARRRGCAQRMLRLVADWALSELNIDCVELLIDESNAGSVGVARACGFRKLDETRQEMNRGRTATLLVFEMRGPDD